VEVIGASRIVAKARAIIFDLFHTLTSLESTNAPGKGTSQILKVSRQDWNEQLWRYSRDRLTGQLEDPYEIIRTMAHAIDPNIERSVIEQATATRIRRFEYSLVNIPERNLRVLRDLRSRGKKVGLISDADRVEAAAWGRSPLSELFDVAIFSCDVGCVKPERQIYQEAMDRLGVSAHECVFVGDGGSDELRGAKAVGMHTIMTIEIRQHLWPDSIQSLREGAHCVISSLEELTEGRAKPRA
jgi:putative hydrolase of the HAD superfamily